METLTSQKPEVVPGPVIAELDRNPAMTPEMVEALGGLATGEVYFHGSNFPFKIGDEIRPGQYAIRDEHGLDNASAATNENTAWFYAEAREAQYGGRGKVFKVVPSDGQLAKRLGPQRGEVNSRTFTVVDEINIKPGRQGTIPDVDWRKYHPYTSPNHPEDPLWTREPDPVRPALPSRDEVPLPGLGEEYVKAEKERLRIKAGIPLM